MAEDTGESRGELLSAPRGFWLARILIKKIAETP